MLKNEKHSNSFSKPIVRISIFSIILGVCAMILTLSIATGFQNGIKKKLQSFGSDVQIESMYNNYNNETSPLVTLGLPIDSIQSLPSIKEIQKFAYKSAIVQSKSKNETNNREVQGLIFKGLENSNNMGFFKDYLIKGECPNFSNKGNDTIVLSNNVCQKLGIDINDKIRSFFISNGNPKQRNFVVGGIYETGLDKIDQQFGFICLHNLSVINNWGTTIKINVEYTNDSNSIRLNCTNKSKEGIFLYEWGNNTIEQRNHIDISSKKDTQITIKAYELTDLKDRSLVSIPDTLTINYNAKNKQFNFQNDIGSGQYYTGGYEIALKDSENPTILEDIKMIFGPEYNVTDLEEKYSILFSWLKLIYQNVYIIIGLMIAVAIINMSSALLVLIVEKTKMIGILKSLGTSNKSLRKIFVIHGGLLITIGFIGGNLLAFLIIILQNHYGFLKLPQENYYLDTVPMAIPISNILILNASTFLFCYLAMVLPSYVSTKISPVRAIASEI